MKDKLNNWKVLLVIIGVCIVVALALFSMLVNVEKHEAEITVGAETVTLKIGDTWEIPVTVAEGEEAPEISYAADNASIASVSDKGLVTALREGETLVRVSTKGGQKAMVGLIVAAEEKSSKVIYLTYEGGPSMEVTPALLELLEKYDAKATFFPYGQEAESCTDPLEDAVGDGHTVGVYTYSPEYAGICESVEAYLADFHKTAKIIRDITDVQPEYWRFPGGSNNDNMTEENREVIMDELHKEGYVCVDWNCYIDDLTEEEQDAKSMARMGIQTIDQAIAMGQIPVVRMYDRTDEGQTLEVTRKIIKHYKKKGYEFRAVSDYEGTDLLAGEK